MSDKHDQRHRRPSINLRAQAAYDERVRVEAANRRDEWAAVTERVRHRLAGHVVDVQDDGSAVVTMPNDQFFMRTCEVRDPWCDRWAVASVGWLREGPFLACFGCAQHSVKNRSARLYALREGLVL